MSTQHLRIGLIVNPVAGLGGTVALKGSDGAAIQQAARDMGALAQASSRCGRFLSHLFDACASQPGEISWLTCSGPMGANALAEQAWTVQIIQDDARSANGTDALDTRRAAVKMKALGIDLLVFVGGDGTARDIYSAVGGDLPVLGIPAGVKMHSGVFAVTPKTGAELVERLLHGGLVAKTTREVRDYDEASNAGEMRVRAFGEMCVPDLGGYIQQTKVGGKESEPLALEEICAAVVEVLPSDRNFVLAPGSTLFAIKRSLGFEGTLRGCDILRASGEVLLDVPAHEVEKLSQPMLIVSFTRHQGFLFGRGNQQLSAVFLDRLNWPEDVIVVASRTKLASLEQRPLLVDTGNEILDTKLAGLVEVTTGYEDSLFYRIATQAD